MFTDLILSISSIIIDPTSAAGSLCKSHSRSDVYIILYDTCSFNGVFAGSSVKVPRDLALVTCVSSLLKVRFPVFSVLFIAELGACKSPEEVIKGILSVLVLVSVVLESSKTDALASWLELAFSELAPSIESNLLKEFPLSIGGEVAGDFSIGSGFKTGFFLRLLLLNSGSLGFKLSSDWTCGIFCSSGDGTS